MRGCFSDGGGFISFLSGGHWGGIGFEEGGGGGGGGSKKIVGWRGRPSPMPPTLWETLPTWTSTF